MLGGEFPGVGRRFTQPPARPAFPVLLPVKAYNAQLYGRATSAVNEFRNWVVLWVGHLRDVITPGSIPSGPIGYVCPAFG